MKNYFLFAPTIYKNILRAITLSLVFCLNTVEAVKPPSTPVIDSKKLKIIEDFLSTMITLEASMTMDITNGPTPEHHEGKIWLDRKTARLRLDYGKNKMIAKDSVLSIFQENQDKQEFFTNDTPAGILLKPSIDFAKEGITVKSLEVIQDLWQLSLVYESPAGSVPIVMYFKPKPVMLLLGWSIQNLDQSITNVHLDEHKTHMSIDIKPEVFEVR